MWDAGIVVLALALAIALRRGLRGRISAGPRGTSIFWAGAGIYVATFALVRSSDYRLVFLLLTIPQLLRWAAVRRVFAIATLGAVLLTLWLPSEWANVPFVNDVIRRWNDLTTRAGGDQLQIAAPAQVAAFIGLICLLAATFPRTTSAEQSTDTSARFTTRLG